MQKRFRRKVINRCVAVACAFAAMSATVLWVHSYMKAIVLIGTYPDSLEYGMWTQTGRLVGKI